jgi:transposase
LCRPYRAKTKGKVERFNGYLKGSFLVPLAATLKQAIADTAAKRQDSLADFLDRLLAAECSAREQRTREAMLK